MKPLPEVHFRVIDNGIFLPIARRLARDGNRVSYWSPDQKAFRTVKDQVGRFFDDVERVRSMWYDKKSVDCWVFSDIGFADEQLELVSQGVPVWGCRDGDSLEIMRGKFLKMLEKTELPVPPHRAIVGMTALKTYLYDKEDKYIKISDFRGDWETFHFRDWEQDEPELEIRSIRLGPMKDHITYYVCDPIKAKIEDGYDGYNIDGEWPSLCIHGMEAKDKAFLASIQKFSELPKELKRVNDAIGPVLAEYKYKGLLSTEVRIDDDLESWFNDITTRPGSPPSQVMMELFGNFPEIVWEGANGNLVDPEPTAQFGVQGLLKISGDRSAWQKVVIPKELDQWVKCGFVMMSDDATCFPPDEKLCPDVGWLVGIGDTIQEAIDHLKENCEMLPDGLTCEYSALAELLKEVEDAEAKGMEFTDQPIPKPEAVVGK